LERTPDTTQPAILCYEIARDARLDQAEITVWANGSQPRSGRPAQRVTVRGDAKTATIVAIVSVIRTHYLNTLSPDSSRSAIRLTRAQDAALARLIRGRVDRRPITRNPVTTITSSDIAAALLKSIIAPPADFWAERHSVPRSSGDGTWTVSRARDGTWGCSCPRWRFKREHCKHIDEVQAHPHWYPYTP